MKIVSFSLESGNRYFGRIDGQRFFIGSRVSYAGGKGLLNETGGPAARYDRTLYRAAHGFWADFLHPTATAEGALFHTLNTYDRARFTFSFLQLAAHVPDGDFVTYFRRLLALPLAAEYFPDLRVVAGRVHRLTEQGAQPLESKDSTAGLLDFLNPTATFIEDTEVIQAAKMIHWVQNDPAHRQLQVDIGVALWRDHLARYAAAYALDGVADVPCLLVCDIRHQGRGSSSQIRQALAAPDPVAALLAIGEPTYHQRLLTLRREIARLTAEGVFGHRVYDAKAGDFR